VQISLLSKPGDVTLSEKDFRRVSNLIYDYCGINLHVGKKELVRARLAKRVRRGGFGSFTQYIEYALNDPAHEEFSSLVDCLTTNTTSFFREEKHFAFLKDVVLPHMIEAKRGEKKNKIRAWSAACSSGEEPYSLAITVLDKLDNPGAWDVKILATDISTRMLERCRVGLYPKERVQPVPPQQRQRYLQAVRIDGETHYEVGPGLRSVVMFRYLNLMEAWPFRGPFDFIFCRNVMIYFDKPTQEKLINRLWEVLAPGGFLFVGHSESLTGIKHPFRYVQPTIYEKMQNSTPRRQS